MVRMVGIRSISLSHLYDNGIRLTHPAACVGETAGEWSEACPGISRR